MDKFREIKNCGQKLESADHTKSDTDFDLMGKNNLPQGEMIDEQIFDLKYEGELNVRYAQRYYHDLNKFHQKIGTKSNLNAVVFESSM